MQIFDQCRLDGTPKVDRVNFYSFNKCILRIENCLGIPCRHDEVIINGVEYIVERAVYKPTEIIIDIYLSEIGEGG